MELVPETEEILVQRIGRFGCIKTSRYAINDLELTDRTHLNSLFYSATKTFVDKNMIFRAKSTGEYLFFDPEGLWYEEGLNHELLIWINKFNFTFPTTSFTLSLTLKNYFFTLCTFYFQIFMNHNCLIALLVRRTVINIKIYKVVRKTVASVSPTLGSPLNSC